MTSWFISTVAVAVSPLMVAILNHLPSAVRASMPTRRRGVKLFEAEKEKLSPVQRVRVDFTAPSNRMVSKLFRT